MGWEGWSIALAQPGKRHSELRGLLLKGLSPSMVTSYDPLVEKVVQRQVLDPLARSGPEGCDPAVFIDE
jgi:cytochrome P450